MIGYVTLGTNDMARATAFYDALLVRDDIGAPSLAECILTRFRMPVATPPTGNCVDVQIPIRLAIKANP